MVNEIMDFITAHDPDVGQAIRAEYDRQRRNIELIASENFVSEAVLAAAGFGGRMGHGLGHGVGIDIHEEPVLAPRNERPLVAGNVVTVEPGIYLPGKFGMRLEDFGVVTADGFDVFTNSTHDLVVI